MFFDLTHKYIVRDGQERTPVQVHKSGLTLEEVTANTVLIISYCLTYGSEYIETTMSLTKR